MSIGIIDTTVVVHLFRKQKAAHNWIKSLSSQPSITSITWLEFMEGANSKANQTASKNILSQFSIVYPGSK